MKYTIFEMRLSKLYLDLFYFLFEMEFLSSCSQCLKNILVICKRLNKMWSKPNVYFLPLTFLLKNKLINVWALFCVIAERKWHTWSALHSQCPTNAQKLPSRCLRRRALRPSAPLQSAPHRLVCRGRTGTRTQRPQPAPSAPCRLSPKRGASVSFPSGWRATAALLRSSPETAGRQCPSMPPALKTCREWRRQPLLARQHHRPRESHFPGRAPSSRMLKVRVDRFSRLKIILNSWF